METGAELIKQLQEVRGVTENKAEGLVAEYQTMETISWAVRCDKDYVQDTFKIDPDFLRGELRDEDMWAPYYQRKQQLKIPDRRQDYVDKYLDQGQQQRIDDYADDDAER